MRDIGPVGLVCMVALYAGVIIGESFGYYSAAMLPVNSNEQSEPNSDSIGR